MSTRDDVLDLDRAPDRVFYELGVMLDKDDFRSEQGYHRGRLARALAFLHGAGTVAGLKVEIPTPAGTTPDTEEIHVHPGLAIDEVGRLIEVSTLRCTRLKKWFDAQSADPDSAEGQRRAQRLRTAFHAASPGGSSGKVVVDVFVRFAACDRGKTPAFATGAFDALDAVQPSRIRDGFELQLVPRDEPLLPVPEPWWPTPTGTPAQKRRALSDAVFAAWEQFRPKDRRQDIQDDNPLVPEWLDPTGSRHWLLLARLGIPATLPASGPPVRIGGQAVECDPYLRAFVHTTTAVLRLLNQP